MGYTLEEALEVEIKNRFYYDTAYRQLELINLYLDNDQVVFSSSDRDIQLAFKIFKKMSTKALLSLRYRLIKSISTKDQKWV